MNQGKRGAHVVRRARTQELVIGACIQSLAEWGYQATTTTLVAERAGVSRGALLQQLPTRLDLILAVATHIVEAQRAKYEAGFSELPDPLERFRAMTDLLWGAKGSPERIAVIEIHLASRSEPELAAGLRDAVNTPIREQVQVARDLAREAGIDNDAQVHALATLTLAAVWGLSIMELELWTVAEIDAAFDLLKHNRDHLIADWLREATPKH